jgi:L-malate glycosyltransferase
MNHPPRVIFFISAFFPEPTGATYSAIRLARALREQGVSVQWIVDDRDGRWNRGGEYEGFPVRSFYFSRSGKWKKIKGWSALTLFLIRRRRTFDIFHIHGGGHMNVLIGGWVKLLFRRKKVIFKCTLDGWDTPDGIVRDKYGPLLLWIYRHFDGIVAMTSGQYTKVRASRCKGLTDVIPNGTDCDRYRPDSAMRSRMRENIGIPTDAPVIIYLGALERRKGTDVLLQLWKQLMVEYENLYLMLVGNYHKNRNNDAALIHLLKESGIDPILLEHSQLIRIGQVENAEHYLQAADIFVFPSRQEGFGTVQTEAMACGLPCVVNDLPGISCDIFSEESEGLRIDKNNVQEYARRISDLLSDPCKREAMGEAARQRVMDQFSLESVGIRYLAFYQKLLNVSSR